MGADLGVPLSDFRLLCVSVAGGESRKTFTQFSKRENVKTWYHLVRSVFYYEESNSHQG